MFRLLVLVLSDAFRSRASLEAEIVALRHQVAVLKGRLGRRRLRLSNSDPCWQIGSSAMKMQSNRAVAGNRFAAPEELAAEN